MKKESASYRQGRNRPQATLYQQRGIIGRILKGNTLELDINKQSFRFENIDTFKIFLSTKADIPASKSREIFSRTNPQLEEEIRQLEQIERSINDSLAATIRDPKSIDDYLGDASLVRFSHDHNWRDIMLSLGRKGPDFGEYKLEAVTYYLKYLRSRIDLARDIQRERLRSLEEDATKQVMMETIETRSLTKAEQERYYREAQEAAVDDSTRFTDTRQMESRANLNASDFTRIPRGKTIIIEPQGIDKIPVHIARRKFVIDLAQDPVQLISERGENFTLVTGENLIGRGAKCSIVFNPEYVDISRQHLVIELQPDSSLRFTDMSSAGTSLPRKLIKSA